MEKLPQFKYSPNAYEIGVFEQEEGTCSICNQERELRYTGSFYSVETPDYICPWCIEDGSAAQKYKGEFNDFAGIEGASLDEKALIPKELSLQASERTPSYISWQQEEWMSHCSEPCAFIGYADGETIKPIIDELKPDIEERFGYDVDFVLENLTKDGSMVGYLFQCVNCGKHRLHIDFD